MAEAARTLTGDGSTNSWSFSFSYLKKSHIKLYIDGVEDTTFTWLTDSSVAATTTPSNGAVVLIQRVTPRTALDTTIPGSGTVRGQDHNNQALQALYVATEGYDALLSTMSLDAASVYWDAETKRIKNVVDPTDAQDVVTKAWAESGMTSQLALTITARTAAQTAQTGAELAETNAETAQAAAVVAKNSAETAQTAAELAETNAETAQTAAELAETNAGNSATAASGSASTASTHATNAGNSATAASNSASAASTSADEAAASAATLATIGAFTINKGDLIVGGAADWVDLAVGANDLCLVADSAQASGVKWGSIPIATVTGLTSALSGKAATSHNHAASEITSGTLTDARVAASNVTQHQAALSITESQISDLGTYATLGQDAGLNSQTANYTLVLADKGKVVEMDNASARTITVPPNSSVAFPVGTRIDLLRLGAGTLTVVAGSGVTVSSVGGNLALNGQYSMATLVKRATDTWILVGSLE